MGPCFATSPYKCPQLHITFGKNKEVYYVPRVFLEDQDWISNGDMNYVFKFGEEVGHVLIHFLFTGEYQILEIYETKNSEDETSALLRIALGVFFALQEWILPRLRCLVKSEIESLSGSIHIFDIVRLIDEIRGKKTITGQLWLFDFLTRQMNAAFKDNYKHFDNFSLFDELQNQMLIKFMGKTLANIYHTRLSKVNEAGSEATKSPEIDSLSALTLTPDTLSSYEY